MKPTDFVASIRRSQASWQPVVRSLLDVDFYKFTMGLFIYKLYRGVTVKFSLINRHVKIPLAKIVSEADLRRELDHVRTLKLRRTDIIWLRGQDYYGSNLFPDDYLKFLSELQLCEYKIVRNGDQFFLDFEGPWEVVTFWETIALAIISELFYRKLMENMSDEEIEILYANASNKLYYKLCALKRHDSIMFADFGQRRRHSFLWQKYAIEMSKEVMGSRFTGTSNAWMSFNQDIAAIGTNAHELPMVLTALANSDQEMIDAQYEVIRKWYKIFDRGGLRVLLPDTYGSAQFFANMPNDVALEVAHKWRGPRLDSGDPIVEGNEYLKWLDSFGIDPIKEGKVIIPSDGLDVDSMIRIDEEFRGRIAHPFGWGTKLTNDFEGCHPRGEEEAVVNGEKLGLSWGELFKGHSIVCKVTSANGRPAVKLSNNLNKATGPKGKIARHIKVFGSRGRITQEVVV